MGLKMMSHPDDKRMEHVEHFAGGGMACKHCGGAVGKDGYARMMAEGGEVESDSGEWEMDPAPFDREREELNPEERQDSTEQQARTESMRDGAFVDALRGRRAGMERLEDPEKSVPEQNLSSESEGGPDMSIEERKRQKYEFMKRKG